MHVFLCPCLGLLFCFVYADIELDEIKAGVELPVEIGKPVSLPCLNKVKQNSCSKVTWLSNKSPTVELVTLGIRKSDRLDRKDRVSLLTDCALHFSHVKPEDLGCFTCRQFSGLGGTQIEEDARICLCIKKDTTTQSYDTTSVDNNISLSDSTDDKPFIIIPLVLVVGAFSVAALVIAWLRNHRKAQMTTSSKKQNTLKPETKTTTHEFHKGEDVVTYIELNHNVLKPSEADVDNQYQKTEYAMIKMP
ncbi:uncharacterized protein LOC130247369 [Danio aesculapii]|uniref:uncharacterized protein LOC130247369 n=1 Tax=Danio aesculapii TaxID=1142201 RepID=UPI0024C09ECE|nr:uncharacterized protein LOC130247369 [Danio aesculapii]